MSTISDLIIKIGADNSGLNKSLDESKNALNKTFSDISPMKATEGAINDVGSSVTGLIGKLNSMVAVAAGGFGLNSLIQSAVDAGAAVQTLSETMNISAADASLFAKTIKIAGGDTESASKGLLRLDKALMDSGKAGQLARDTFSAVGVSLTDEHGKLLPVNEQLSKLAEGYKIAQAAGQGQEYVMNTLGSRGVALIPVLNDLAKAQKAASKIEGTGLNPEEMKELQREMRTLEAQAGQLKVALGGVFAEIFGKDIETITADMGSLAKEFRENREEVKAYTKGILGLITTYALLKAAAKVGSSLSAAYSAATAGAAETALTAQQERAIEARIRIIENATRKQEAAYYKTLQAMEVTEAEKTELFSRYVIERETATMEEVAKIRVSMTEMYANNAAAAAESSASQIASIREVGAAAAETAAVQSTASKEAGAAAVLANNNAALSSNKATKEVLKNAESHAKVGSAAVSASGLAVSSCTKVGGVVRGLTSMVWALAGGWLGVAAAIAYAAYCAYQYAQSKEVERQGNTVTLADGTVCTYDGSKGRWYTDNPAATGDYNITADPTGTIDATQQSRVEVSEDMAEEANQKYTEKNWEGSEAQRKQEAKDAEDEAKARAASIPTSIDVGSTSSAAAAEPKEEKPVTVEVPVGQVAYNVADAHIGEDWGDSTCAQFFSSMFSDAGFDIPVGNPNWVPDIVEEAKRRGALHAAGDGFTPKKGDAVVWGDNAHIGISGGDGTHIASNSHGVTSAPDSGYYSYGDPTKYIDMTAFSGGKTITQSMDKASAAMVTAASKLEKAQDKANNLMATLKYGSIEGDITNYQKSKHEIKVDVDRKSKEVNELEASGVDVTALRQQLEVYKNALETKLLKPWHDAQAKIKTDAAATTATTTGDFVRAASVQKEVAIRALDEEREKKQKEIMKDKNDKEGALLVDTWYYAERQKIDNEYTKSLQQAQHKRLQYLADKGAYKAILQELRENGQSRQSFLNVEGEKQAAEEIIKIYDAANASIAGNVAAAAETLYGSLTNSIDGFIKRTKSAMDVVHDFGNAIMSEIARVMAQKMAANIIGALFGGFGRGGGGSNFMSGLTPSTSTFMSSGSMSIYNSPYVPKLAAGGVVSAPTLALIGEGSEPEAVVPLSKLSAMNGGGAGAKVQVNIVNNSDAKPRVAESHYDASVQKTVLSIVIDGAQRDIGGFGRSLKTALR